MGRLILSSLLCSSIAICILVLPAPTEAIGFAPELYCGLENCYDVLGINRDEFDKAKLSKQYRALARKHHPDRAGRDELAKAAAEERFRVIATAYETLKDDEIRQEYDYYLDHPEERWINYYQYYRRKLTPHVDVRLVLAVTILGVSAVQWLSAQQKYSEALSYAYTVGKYRNMAIDTGLKRGVLEAEKGGKLKKVKGRNNEEIIRSIIAENMDVRGGYKPASLYDTLAWHVLILPYSIVLYAAWWSRWAWNFWLKKQPYDNEAKRYLIRKHLGIGEAQFNCMTESEVEEMLEDELWVKSKFDVWKKERDAEEQAKLAQSGHYKRYKRFLKKNAGNTISFLDEDF